MWSDRTSHNPLMIATSEVVLKSENLTTHHETSMTVMDVSPDSITVMRSPQQHQWQCAHELWQS